MKRTFKKITAMAVSAIMLVGTMPCIANAETGINVNYRTPEEIAEYINAHPFEYSATEYASTPDYTNAPYSTGALSDETLQNALNTLNVVRFIAGLDEVELSDEYNELAQAGCLVNAVNNEMTHEPTKPDGMSDELFEKGYKGNSSANIGWNYKSLSQNIIKGWIGDNSSPRVGHRRWCLNPTMEYTGFGHVGAYTSMYAFDNNWAATEYYGVCWPAQIMPEGFFEDADPWSISMGYEVDSSAVEVELVRKSDGKTWNFSESSADGYFHVNNAYYGKQGCIIFTPDDISYSTGDSFEVTITGLDEHVNYTVDFVDVFAEEPSVNADNLSEIIKFIVNRQYNTEKVMDLNNDDKINVFDAISARRKVS